MQFFHIATPEGKVIEWVHGMDVYRCLLYTYIVRPNGTIVVAGDGNPVVRQLHQDFDVVDRSGAVIHEARIKKTTPKS